MCDRYARFARVVKRCAFFAAIKTQCFVIVLFFRDWATAVPQNRQPDGLRIWGHWERCCNSPLASIQFARIRRLLSPDDLIFAFRMSRLRRSGLSCRHVQSSAARKLMSNYSIGKTAAIFAMQMPIKEERCILPTTRMTHDKNTSNSRETNGARDAPRRGGPLTLP